MAIYKIRPTDQTASVRRSPREKKFMSHFEKQLRRPLGPAPRRDLSKPALPQAMVKMFAADDALLDDIRKRLDHLERAAGITKPEART